MEFQLDHVLLCYYPNSSTMKSVLLSVFLFGLFACQQSRAVGDPVPAPEPSPASIINKHGKTLEERFQTPKGYIRKPEPANSYATFLRKVPLKADGSPVLYYDGQVKRNHNVYEAVLTYDVGKLDLQQCADAVMRLRAEYLFSIQQPERIHFNFTNGFRAGFDKWMEGYRFSIQGNKVSWVKSAAPSSGHQSLRNYLEKVYSYAGTLSLSKELKPVPFGEMKIGDVLIVGGSPGHAVTVMDMAINADGLKLFMLSQGYMPAQDIQVLCNRDRPEISPWYELHVDAVEVRTPEWTFGTSQLARFVD